MAQTHLPAGRPRPRPPEVTKRDLEEMEKRVNMKLSEIKAAVATAAKQSKEAFAELATRIADLQKKIDDLIEGAKDPDVTDAQFLADLQSVGADTKALADLVPGSPDTPQPTP